MEVQREGDLRVPLISSLFCIFVLTGGVFLVLYVFFPNSSQSWYPVVALILIGSPWIFWLMTYLYTCAKACYRRNATTTFQGQISRRDGGGGGSTNMNRSVTQNLAKEGGGSSVTSPNGGEKHVHFGQVVVMEGDEHSREESVSSAKEIEMPLNTAPSS